MSLNFYLQKIIAGGSLTESEAAASCEILLQQQSCTAPAGALLTALHVRGETPDEIVGFAQNLRKQIEPFTVDIAPLTEIASTVPTSLPAVTLGASMLLAAMGAKVTKLLLRGRQAKETDLLPQLGLNNLPSADETARLLQTTGIGFINITQHMEKLRSLRAHQEALGIPHLLDWILPLAHPAKISSLLLGIERPQAVATVAQAMRRLRFDRGFVIASENGTCPFSAPGMLVVAELRNGRILQDSYQASDFGLTIPKDLASDLPANSPAAQVSWLRAFIDRRPSPLTDPIRWAASCGLVASGRAENIPEAIALVDQAITASRLASIISRLETDALKLSA